MRVLFAGRHDWANGSNRIARALRAAGVNARVWCERPHPYGYPEDSWADGEFDEWSANGVDWLIGAGDDAYDVLYAFKGVLEPRNIAPVHGGSQYREHSAHMNDLDASLGARCRFIGVDSMRLADGRVPAYPYWNTVERFAEPDEKRDGILHIPSKRSSKGTALILRAAELAGVELTLLEGVAPADVPEHMGRAAVYVDELNHHVGGVGTTGFEAAAMGCAVISDMRHWPVALPWSPPFQQVRDVDDLAHVFRDLKGSGGRAVRTGWYMHRAPRDHAWAEQYATQEAVAAHWISVLQRHAR